DMRMDQTQDLSAEEIVNKTSPRELFVILKKGGVGRDAKNIAQAIVANRPIQTTGQLARIAENSASKKTREKAVHPATVVFQAIRMEVNEELSQIESLLEVIPRLISARGRASIITFHSLEDKLVTSRMRHWEKPDTAPPGWKGDRSRDIALGTLLTRKPIVAGEDELAANPGARSARLRVFEFNGEQESVERDVH
ncbi:MAG: 16S rRNA (cytosine(1402)-N(4))-methyltransferase RsmH, partial [Bdellovibrionales bacterium]|nr:16S rRNA (cytosine(1402)-N(4))-methyltransferase RsmH [Bdellovibrionales bacterium]